MEKKELSKLSKKKIELNVFEKLFNELGYHLTDLEEKINQYSLRLEVNPDDYFYKEKLIEFNYEKYYVNSLIQMFEKQI